MIFCLFGTADEHLFLMSDPDFVSAGCRSQSQNGHSPKPCELGCLSATALRLRLFSPRLFSNLNRVHIGFLQVYKSPPGSPACSSLFYFHHRNLFIHH